MIEHVLLSIVRSFTAFLVLMLVAIWLGKQVNSHKNYYNFALSLIIGSFMANMGFDTNIKFIPMLAGFLTIIIVYFLIAKISYRSRRFSHWFSGKPTVIIKDGKILEGDMKKIKFTLDNLNQQLRELGIFDVSEVEFALLEVSGNVSVLKKAKYQSLTKNDLFSFAQNQKLNFPVELIVEGNLIEKNFDDKYTREWLNQQLQLRNLKGEQVHYAVISTNGTLFIDLFQDN
jgi:uncharacterized membrane protein YcaP (DUF421 family)